MTTTQWFIQGEPGRAGARLLRKDGSHHEAWNAVEGRWVATLTLLGPTPGAEGKEISQVGERMAMAYFPEAFHSTFYAMGDTLLVRGPDGSYLWTGRHWLKDLMVSVEGLPPVDVQVARQRWPGAFIRERSQPA